MKALRVIAQIDRALCRLYGLSREHRARDFVAPGERLGELLIRQTGHGDDAELELGIRLQGPLLDALGQALGAPNPLPHLSSLAVAVEEVSHFRYVVERVRRRQGVSPFELELQGEVDRFAVLYFWALRGAPLDYPLFRELEARCFAEFREARPLDPSELARYRDAHSIARRVVGGKIASIVRKSNDPSELLALLRKFYHASLAEKVAEAA